MQTGTALALTRAMLWLAFLLAVLVGLSLGLLGGGGSILALPILRYTIGMEARPAIATSLLVVGMTSIAALIPHARSGNVRWRTGALFGAAGMSGAYLAARAAKYLPELLLLAAFALMMFVTAGAMLRQPAPPTGPALTPSIRPRFAWGKVIIEGFVVGMVTGLVGAGGGFLVVPALVLLGGMPMRPAIGTSLLVIAMKSLAGFAGFVGHTPINWNVALLVSLGAVVGSVAGAGLSAKLAPAKLRGGFGWLVMAVAFFLTAQEIPAAWGGRSSLLVSLLSALLGTGAVGLAVLSRRLRRKGLLPRSRAA